MERERVILSNRTIYTLIAFGIIILFGIGVYAYGGTQPSVVGHSVGEIEEADPTVTASVKDGIAWSEISGIPRGFADGVDNGTIVSNLTVGSTQGYIITGGAERHFVNTGDINSYYACSKWGNGICGSGWISCPSGFSVRIVSGTTTSDGIIFCTYP